MNDLYDRTDFLRKEGTRIEVALACRDRALTKTEIARALGREPGGISAIPTLERHGVLERAGRAPAKGRRPGGRRWRLSEDWLEAVERASAQQLVGAVGEGSELLLLSTQDTSRACQMLAAEDPPVSWGVPLHGERTGLLLCTPAKPVGAGLRLFAALAQADINPIRVHIPQVLPRGELRAWAREIAGEPADPALPGAAD